VYKQSFSCTINCTEVKQTATKLHRRRHETQRVWSRSLLQMSQNPDFMVTLTSTPTPYPLFQQCGIKSRLFLFLYSCSYSQKYQQMAMMTTMAMVMMMMPCISQLCITFVCSFMDFDISPTNMPCNETYVMIGPDPCVVWCGDHYPRVYTSARSDVAITYVYRESGPALRRGFILKYTAG